MSVFWQRMKNRGALYFALYMLCLPTLIGKAVFSYYPKFSAIQYSLFRWDGAFVKEFRGLANFIEAFNDPLFWQTFQLVGILLAANLVKMIPSIIAAIALHRITSERLQYIYRVLFVIPMVIPALVWLLIWKSFYDPNVGVLNVLLRKTGLMGGLQKLDQVMPTLAAAVVPWRDAIAGPLAGDSWGLLVVGVAVLSMLMGVRGMRKAWVWWAILAIPFFGLLGWVRGITTLAIIVPAGEWIRHQGFTGPTVLKWIGGTILGLGIFFILATMVWYEPTLAFNTGAPAWLGHSKLVIPALLFWGFPWVGVVGVLIYLAGLQNISQDVYEAADIDGAGPVRKLFSIELPLILAQVRINLIFMTIGTLNDYAFFLILLGPDGGPGNKGMVPGLYMYNEAFVNGRFGYACALGMVLFVLILLLTVIYQKYVKVEK